MMATVSAGAVPTARPDEADKKRPRETAMITSSSRSAGVRFAFAILLSAIIAGGYLSAIGFLNPGFVA
jgi:hypothetical protein